MPISILYWYLGPRARRNVAAVFSHHNSHRHCALPILQPESHRRAYQGGDKSAEIVITINYLPTEPDKALDPAS